MKLFNLSLSGSFTKLRNTYIDIYIDIYIYIYANFTCKIELTTWSLRCPYCTAVMFCCISHSATVNTTLSRKELALHGSFTRDPLYFMIMNCIPFKTC